MKRRFWSVVLVCSMSGSVALARPATKPATLDAEALSPQTRPAAVDPDVAALVNRLADPNAEVREEATRKVAGMGKAALPALEAVKDSDDPELRGRARSLIRRAERRLPPAAPVGNPLFHSQSMKMTVRNGVRTIDINDNGHRIHIEQVGPAIKMSVTGIEEGQEATEQYEAANAETLKEDHPEAYALYERWGGGAGGKFILRGGVGGGAVQGGVPIGPPPARPPANNAMERLKEMLQRQLQEGNLPADQQRLLQEQINQVEQMADQIAPRLVDPLVRPDAPGDAPPDAPRHRPASPAPPAPGKAPPDAPPAPDGPAPAGVPDPLPQPDGG